MACLDRGIIISRSRGVGELFAGNTAREKATTYEPYHDRARLQKRHFARHGRNRRGYKRHTFRLCFSCNILFAGVLEDSNRNSGQSTTGFLLSGLIFRGSHVFGDIMHGLALAVYLDLFQYKTVDGFLQIEGLF